MNLENSMTFKVFHDPYEPCYIVGNYTSQAPLYSKKLDVPEIDQKENISITLSNFPHLTLTCEA